MDGRHSGHAAVDAEPTTFGMPLGITDLDAQTKVLKEEAP